MLLTGSVSSAFLVFSYGGFVGNNVLIFNLTSLLLHLQVRPRPLDGSPPDQVSFHFLFFYELDHEPGLTRISSGAQVVFHSFIQPVFGRFFAGGNTSANLRAQADAATKAQ